MRDIALINVGDAKTVYNILQEVIILLDKKRMSLALKKYHEARHYSAEFAQLLPSASPVYGTYQSMKHYILQGIQDPERSNIYAQLTAQLLGDVHCCMAYLHTVIYYPEYYKNHRGSTAAKSLLEQGTALVALAAERTDEFYQARDQYIDTLRFSMPWRVEDTGRFMEIWNNTALETTDRLFILTGIYLSLHAKPDYTKANILSIIASDEMDAHLRYRAKLLMLLYEHQVYPQNEGRVETKWDKTSFKKFHIYDEDMHIDHKREFTQIYQIVIENLYTPHLVQIFKEDIIPGLTQDMHKAMGSDDEMIRKHPEFGLSKEVENNMQRISELNEKGHDIYYMTFLPLKRLSFYNRPVNWLMPFDFRHPELKSVLNKTALGERLRRVCESAMMCDNDKFSLMKLVDEMGEHVGEAILSKMEGDTEAWEQLADDMIERNAHPINETRHFLHDLNRYLTLKEGREFKKSALNINTSFTQDDCIANKLELELPMADYCDFLATHRCYLEALRLPINYDTCSFDTIRHIIYAQDKLAKGEGGVTHDDMQEFSDPIQLLKTIRTKRVMTSDESYWIKRREAYFYVQSKDPVFIQRGHEIYIELYEKVDQPDDTISFNAASAYIHLNRVKDAIKIYQRLLFTYEENGKNLLYVWQGLAWAYLFDWQLDKAQQYQDLVVSKEDNGYTSPETDVVEVDDLSHYCKATTLHDKAALQNMLYITFFRGQTNQFQAFLALYKSIELDKKKQIKIEHTLVDDCNQLLQIDQVTEADLAVLQDLMEL